MSGETELPPLQLRLLGAPSVTLAGREVTEFTSAKVQALLFYLAVTKAAHRRASLAALFWPNASEQKAHASLRKALAILRKLLPGVLIADRYTLALRRGDIWVDTEHFELLLKQDTSGSGVSIDPLAVVRQYQAAASLYAGEFLAGFHVGDAVTFEQWAASMREQYRQDMVGTLLYLARWHAAQPDDVACLDTLGRLLMLDPGHETAQRLRMQVLTRTGRRATAILEFDAHRRYLAEELGIDPEAETAALYDQLLEGETGDTTALSVGSPTTGAVPPTLAAPSSLPDDGLAPQPAPSPSSMFPQVDWGEMPARTTFIGRPKRMAQLMSWLTGDAPSSLVMINGMGGVGKTSLAAELVHRLAGQSVAQHGFARIIWRSLVNAPLLAEVVDDWLRLLIQPPAVHPPTSIDARLALLFAELQRERCLLILDNVESLLGEAGRYRPGYEDYRQLLERMAHGCHRSCLILTTREAPRGMELLARDFPVVKKVNLMGLAPEYGAQLLRACGMQGSEAALAELAARYSGNPLAIKLIASTVTEMYAGKLEALPASETPVFADVRDVLDQQFARLDDLAKSLLTWLAVARTPMLVDDLRDGMSVRPSQRAIWEAIQTLRRASLLTDAHDEGDVGYDEQIDRKSAGGALADTRLTLQNVVMEYITDRLIETTLADVAEVHAQAFHHFGLRTASAPEYIQEMQRRVLVAPLAQALVERYGRTGTIERLCALRDSARAQIELHHGYVAANVLHLFEHLQVDLTGEDFSQMALRQADLRSVSLRNANLRGAGLADARFADNFGSVVALATSADGSFLVAGADCDVIIWHSQDRRPHLVLHGHSHHIWAIAVAPDARHVAASGLDGALIIWDMATGAAVQTLHAPHGILRAIAFSPDGAQLAGGGEGQAVWLWDWKQGNIVTTLTVSDTIGSIGFVSPTELLVSVGYQGLVQGWDLATQTLRYTLQGPRSRNLSMIVSADGAYAVTGNHDSCLCIWDLHQLRLAGVLHGHSGWIMSLSFSPDGEHVASAGTDGAICLWNLAARQLVQKLTGHRGWVRAVAYMRDGRHIVSGGYDQTLRVWRLHDSREVQRLQGSLRWVNTLLFSPDGAFLAGATLAGDVHLWRGDDLTPVRAVKCDDAPVRALAFTPDSRWLATASDAGNVSVWGVADGERRYALAAHTSFVRSLAFDRSGRFLASGSLDQTIRIWDVAHGALLRILSNATTNLDRALVFSPCNDLLAYGDCEGRVHLYDPQLGQARLSLPNSAPSNVLAFAQSGMRLACGARDGSITVWDLAQDESGEWNAAQRLRVHRSHKRPWRLLFSPDGRYLAWNGEGIDINVVALEGPQNHARPSESPTDGAADILYRLSGNHHDFGMAATQAGSVLVAAAPDHAVVVHSVATGEVRARNLGHSADLTALAIRPDGAQAAVADAGGAIQLWPLTTPVTSGSVLTSSTPVAAVKLLGPYHGMNLTGATGLTLGQRQTLMELGAVDDSES